MLSLATSISSDVAELASSSTRVPTDSSSLVFTSPAASSRNKTPSNYILCTIYWVVVLHCIALALQLCCLYDASVRCLPFHINSTEHSIITQAGNQWVLCFSGSLPIALFISDWLYFLCYSRKINTMMMITSCMSCLYNMILGSDATTPVKWDIMKPRSNFGRITSWQLMIHISLSGYQTQLWQIVSPSSDTLVP